MRRLLLRALCGLVRDDGDDNGLATTDRVLTGLEMLRDRAIQRYPCSMGSPDNVAVLLIVALG